jgi:hypothetical protein
MADGQIPGKFICLRTRVFHVGKSHNDDLADSHRHQLPLIDQVNASSKLHKTTPQIMPAKSKLSTPASSAVYLEISGLHISPVVGMIIARPN